MNGHAVETVEHLLQNGANATKAHELEIHDLDASKLTVTLTKSPGKVPELDSKEVWSMKSNTDHMVRVTWTDDVGWHAPTIEPYGQLTMSPIASCLHYATQCFEGMKAYRGFDGKLRLFRPDKNCNRLVMSSARVALPTFDPKELEKLLKAFMKVDGPSKLFQCPRICLNNVDGEIEWLPKSRPGTFLYIRPAIIGNGEQIGVTAPSEVLMFIVAVGWPDLSSGTPPGAAPTPPGLKLLASKSDVRAWPGGFGYAKVGANYGPAFVSHMEGRKMGYDQILWLLGSDYQASSTYSLLNSSD
jgi:branched-chain amino acid aminotransferase